MRSRAVPTVLIGLAVHGCSKPAAELAKARALRIGVPYEVTLDAMPKTG